MSVTNEEEESEAYSCGWFIETKLQPATASFKLIDRPKIINAIQQAVALPLGLIVAPAGYGKSSALFQWRQKALSSDINVAWLSLDEMDTEVRHAVSYIILTLAKSGLHLGTLELAARQSLIEISLDTVLARLINAIADTKRKVVLILDDFYLAESPAVDQFIGDLIKHAPSNFCVLISSRVLPGISASSFIAKQQATEIGPSLLKFSLQETRELFSADTSEQEIAQLFKKTEGWVFAIQFASLLSKSLMKPNALSPEKHQHIANFFAEQILGQASSNEKQLLLKTSIFERFNPQLAQVVCDSEIVRETLFHSVYIQSLLKSTDIKGQWFEYHKLFSDFLYDQLVRMSPTDACNLHLQASNWFEKNGYLLDAVKHAIKAKSKNRAAQLILDAGGWELMLYRGIGLIRTLLRFFSKNDFDDFPRLRIAWAYSLMKDGKMYDAEMQLNKIQLTEKGNKTESLVSALQRDFDIISAILNVYRDNYLTDSSLQGLLNVLSNLQASDVLGKGVLQASASLAAISQGYFQKAEELALAGVRSMRSADSVLGINYCYIHLGHIALYRADFELASAHLTEATMMAEDNFGADSRLKTNCNIDFLAMKYWQNCYDFDSALLFDDLAKACNTDSWYDVYATGFSCLFDLKRHTADKDSARKLIETFQKTAYERGINRLRALIPVFKLYVALAARDTTLVLTAINTLIELGEQSKEAGNINWMVRFESCIALGVAHAQGYFVKDINTLLANAIKLAQSLEANLYIIRLIVIKTVIVGSQTGLHTMMDDLFYAIRISARESIKTPFLTTPKIADYIKQTLRSGREWPERRLEVSFLKGCLSMQPDTGNVDYPTPKLSRREMDVLSELALGASNKQIARALDMTDNTVKFHLKNIFQKLQVKNRVAAINAARRADILP